MSKPLSFSLAALLAITAAAIPACESSQIEKAPPRPESTRVENSFEINTPPIMRGTVASEAIILGYEPTLVRGYGLVVGLRGTGDRRIPQDLRAHMLAIAQQGGIGSPSLGWGSLSAEQLLDSQDTAVVIVEALIPPGSKEDTQFDVRVVAHPATDTISLEGGRLYTTELRPVTARGLPPTGTRQAAPLALASGPIFINPFAEPGSLERETINRTLGRVMNGGSVIKDMPIKLRLANPSHSRARSLQGVINAAFPQEHSQRNPTARGESDEGLEITVPPSFRDRPREFVELLRHTTLAQGTTESTALWIKRTLIANADAAEDAAWRWQALGERALPIIRELYDYSEELPRMAALRAGSRLNDPLIVPHLAEMAREGPAPMRREAITMLGLMQSNPRIDLALRPLLSDPEVEIRLVAYEALIERRDPAIGRIAVDDKFILDIVDSPHPLIYITQIGAPRIALFGPDLDISRPITFATWSNRLMVKGELGQELIEVYFRPEHDNKGSIERVKPRLVEFVQFLGHTSSPDAPGPGLGLTYAQAVGALHQLCRQEYVKADFKAQQDRLLAAIMEQEQGVEVIERPEFTAPPTEPAPDENSTTGAAENSSGIELPGAAVGNTENRP